MTKLRVKNSTRYTFDNNDPDISVGELIEDVESKEKEYIEEYATHPLDTYGYNVRKMAELYAAMCELGKPNICITFTFDPNKSTPKNFVFIDNCIESVDMAENAYDLVNNFMEQMEFLERYTFKGKLYPNSNNLNVKHDFEPFLLHGKVKNLMRKFEFDENPLMKCKFLIWLDYDVSQCDWEIFTDNVHHALITTRLDYPDKNFQRLVEKYQVHKYTRSCGISRDDFEMGLHCLHGYPAANGKFEERYVVAFNPDLLEMVQMTHYIELVEEKDLVNIFVEMASCIDKLSASVLALANRFGINLEKELGLLRSRHTRSYDIQFDIEKTIDSEQKLKKNWSKYLSNESFSTTTLPEMIVHLSNRSMIKIDRKFRFVFIGLHSSRNRFLLAEKKLNEKINESKTIDEQKSNSKMSIDDFLTKDYLEKYLVRPIEFENVCFRDYATCFYFSSTLSKKNIKHHTKHYIDMEGDYVFKLENKNDCWLLRHQRLLFQPHDSDYPLYYLQLYWPYRKDTWMKHTSDTIEGVKNFYENIISLNAILPKLTFDLSNEILSECIKYESLSSCFLTTSRTICTQTLKTNDFYFNHIDKLKDCIDQMLNDLSSNNRNLNMSPSFQTRFKKLFYMCQKVFAFKDFEQIDDQNRFKNILNDHVLKTDINNFNINVKSFQDATLFDESIIVRLLRKEQMPINLNFYDNFLKHAEHFEKIKSLLGNQQAKAFDIIISLVLNFQMNLDMGKCFQSAILNGEAGSGKSFLLGYVFIFLKMIGVRTKITSYTAIAYQSILKNMHMFKYNLEKIFQKQLDIDIMQSCDTLHAFFGLPTGQFSPKGEFENFEVVFIDEYSMISTSDLQEIMLKTSRVQQENTNKHQPFGPFLIIMLGDIMQLPPVIGESFWHDQAIFESYFRIRVEITHKHRAKTPETCAFLEAVRNPGHNGQTSANKTLIFETLMSRLSTKDQFNPYLTTHIVRTNREVNAINSEIFDDYCRETGQEKFQLDYGFKLSGPVDSEFENQIDFNQYFKSMINRGYVINWDDKCFPRNNQISIGSKITITLNRKKSLGLVNGASFHIQDIVLKKNIVKTIIFKEHPHPYKVKRSIHKFLIKTPKENLNSL